MKSLASKPSSELKYPFKKTPSFDKTMDIVSNIRWIRLPVFGELQHINVWAIADGDGWTIVDCGLFSPETIEVWENLLAKAKGLEGRPVKRVIVTHMHVDHIGMAGWLTRRFDCQLWITELEYQGSTKFLKGVNFEEGTAFYHRAGWTGEMLVEYRQQANDFLPYVDTLPQQFKALGDGDQLGIGNYNWEVVTGSGHSPNHACLWCEELGIFISGDQVLPTISSNISVLPSHPGDDPLGRWFSSIEKLIDHIPDTALVLPAHGLPFYGLHMRLSQLALGHKKGLQRLREALNQPARVVDLFTVLFRHRKEYSIWLSQLATGECLAHLNWLILEGEVEVSQDKDGVDWYMNRLNRIESN